MIVDEHLARGGLLLRQLRERACNAFDELAFREPDGGVVVDAEEVRHVADAVCGDPLVGDAHGREAREDERQVADDVESFQMDFGLDQDARAAVSGEGGEVAEVGVPGEAVLCGEAAFLLFGLGVGGGDVRRGRPFHDDGVGVAFAERPVGGVAEEGELAAAERVGAEKVRIRAERLAFRLTAGASSGVGAHVGFFPSAPGSSFPSSLRRRWISAAFSYFCRRIAFFSSRSR